MPQQLPYIPRSRRAFTLIEIIVILVIIGLMLLIVVPHYLIEFKAKKAARVKADLVALNAAIEQYALENGKVSGDPVDFDSLRKYLDQNSDAYRTGGKDAFGDTYGPFIVGSRPPVPSRTEDDLSSTVPPEFWSPFQ
jgi:type II secretory pathway pseudopilin PulG